MLLLDDKTHPFYFVKVTEYGFKQTFLPSIKLKWFIIKMHFDRNSLKELFQNFIKAVIYRCKSTVFKM